MRSPALVALLTMIGVVGAVPMTASAAPVTAYYASPTGSGTGCTQAAPCTLAGAVALAKSAGPLVVDLESGSYRNVALDLDEGITLQADPDPVSGTAKPVLEGDGSQDVITVESTVTLDGLAVSGGQDGLIVDPSGAVTVHDSSFDNNGTDGVVDYSSAGTSKYFTVTAEGNADDGIDISNGSTTDRGSAGITDSTFANNGDNGIGVISVGSDEPNVAISNSTSYDNGASGLYVGPDAAAHLLASSVIGNSGAGLYTSGSTAALDAGGNIIADNSAVGGSDCAHDNETSSIITDDGYNVADDSSCPFTGTGSVNGSSTLDAEIGAFGSYGGGVQTVAISNSGPAAQAITDDPDNGTGVCTETDERGLTRPGLPCAAGAFDPDAPALASTFTLAASPRTYAVLGDTITLTASVTGDVGPASGGTVDFTSQRTGEPAAPITTCNGATITDIPVVDGVATCQLPAGTAGTFTFGAAFAGSATYTSNLADPVSNYLVLHPTTTVVDVVSANEVTATVNTDQTATTAPAGIVHFLVDGSSAAPDLVQDGTSTSATATLTLATPLSGPTTVLAQYAGDGTSFARRPDRRRPRTRRSQQDQQHREEDQIRLVRRAGEGLVGLHGRCGLLVGSCPASTTLTASKKNQAVTKTIRNSLGGSVTVTSPAVDIDRVKPIVTVTGVKNGHRYPHGTRLHVKCGAKDILSGLAGKCALTTTHKTRGNSVDYTLRATATDKAGNTTIKTISWKVART